MPEGLAPLPPLTATDRVRSYVTAQVQSGKSPSVIAILGDVVESIVDDDIRKSGEDIMHTEDTWYAYQSRGIWVSRDPVWIKTIIDKWHRQTVLRVPSKTVRGEILEAIMMYVHEEDIDWANCGNVIISANNQAYDLEQDKTVTVKKSWYLREDNLLAVEYDATKTDTPIWDQTVSTIMQHIPDTERADVITLLEEWMGSTLLRHNKPRALSKCLFLYGERRTGKSTILDIPRQIFGESRATAVGLGETDGFGSMALLSKAVWLSDEIAVGSVMNDSVMKRVITNEPISIKVKMKNPIEIRLNMTVGMAGNSLPTIKDTSDAVYDRMLFVPCDTVITNQQDDPALRDKLLAELPAILNRLIQSLQNARQRGFFQIPDCLVRKADEIKTEQDPIRVFLEQAFSLVNISCGVENPDIQTAYKGFLSKTDGEETARHTRVNPTHLSRRISEVFPNTVTGKTKSGTVRAKYGIHFTDQGKAWLDAGWNLEDNFYKTDQVRLRSANIGPTLTTVEK
ncbi:MAG: putative DNA primase [Prokaryotic dsDNA virus sp.]|nr:MAG: putative DNA primase [Prokaryotic dsDNA virus sp.]|tara:strand:- start:7502 stop:9034 length:1533 start_codon:yes stop_codon:yes gene_type:complete